MFLWFFRVDFVNQNSKNNSQIIERIEEKREKTTKDKNYNKWFMPAEQRFLKRIGRKNLDSEKSPLRKGNSHKYFFFFKCEKL